jgi:hypothetical protein
MGTDIHGVWQKKTEVGWEDVPSLYEQERHYALFAWLGNVRNGFWFSGVLTHAPIEPLTDGRGYPEGFEVNDDDDHPISSLKILDPRRRRYHDETDQMVVRMGDHSHSWLTAEEILTAIPPVVRRTGIVSRSQFEAWDGVSSPDSWYGGISGPNVVVNDAAEITEATTDVRIQWNEDWAEQFAYFIDEVRRLKGLYGEVRFVFGFDS